MTTTAPRSSSKGYLIDPNDPFTLNNLGYMAELDGDVDRAARYYDLAAQQRSAAIIDESNNPNVQGKPVDRDHGNAADTGMEVNRYNVEAISLLYKDRAAEADVILQKALKLDPKNPFTLNNLGFAREQEGEYESALQYYTAAANIGPRKISRFPRTRNGAVARSAKSRLVTHTSLQSLWRRKKRPRYVWRV